MSFSHIIVLGIVKRVLIIDLVGGAFLTVAMTHFHSLFGAYVAIASSLAACLSSI